MWPEHEKVAAVLDSGVLKLTLSRPEKRNAIDIAMYTELTRQLQRAEADASVRVVLLTGKGDCFTAVNDLDAFEVKVPEGEESAGISFIRQLADFKKPLIASVQGKALGIGVTLLLHCDLVYAAEEASFCMPFIQLGVIPEAGSTALLPQRLGHLKAFEYLALGPFFSAATACQLGLVNEVFSQELLDQKVRQVAKRLAEQPQEALQTTKRLLRQLPHDGLQARISEEAEIFRRLLGSPEAKAARQAFRDKNKK